jgi:hypothetical protein
MMHPNYLCFLPRSGYGDYMKLATEAALKSCIQRDPSFRLSVPRDMLQFTGMVNSDIESKHAINALQVVRDVKLW